uniref:Uncharacterized protein n=1 Tax=Oryzias melastigma TaxID=30732 RepID=A0A3B3CU38_ORYME
MEVSRRRMIHKHLQPTRPLRRFDVEQLYSNVSLHEQKKGRTPNMQTIFYRRIFIFTQYICVLCIFIGRISYSREFLMGLASCPEAKIKPPFLPENPIVLSQAVSL